MVAIFVVFDIHHFRRGRAKLRELPQIVLDLITNLGIFVIECIFDFSNSMCSFCAKSFQSWVIGGNVGKSCGRCSSRSMNPITKTNTSSDSIRVRLPCLPIWFIWAKSKLVKLTDQIRQNRETLAGVGNHLYTRWR